MAPETNHPSERTTDPRGAAASNILAITALEHQAIASRTTGEKIGDFIAREAGRLWFIAVHVIWFAVWMAIGGGGFAGIGKFDPFPFPFLTFVLSLESIFLSLFILMSQNRATKQADARSHLDLQINLLAEQESTAALQMLHKLCEFHGVKLAESDGKVESLKEDTCPATLLEELKTSLPDEG